MNAYYYDKSSNAVALFLMAVVVVLLCVIVWQFSQPKGRVSCASFGSYVDALSALDDGAYWLDGNDKDGVPCESLLKKNH